MTGEKKQKTGDRLWTYIKEEAGYWRRRTKQAPLWSGGLLLLAFVGLAVLGVGPYAGMDGSRPVGVAPGTAGFIRWHFYANSDRPEDQLLKLEVKDRILEEAEAALAGADSAAECRRLLSQILPVCGRRDSSGWMTAAAVRSWRSITGRATLLNVSWMDRLCQREYMKALPLFWETGRGPIGGDFCFRP